MSTHERNLFHQHGFSPQNKNRAVFEMLVPLLRPDSGRQIKLKNDTKGVPFIKEIFIKGPPSARS